MKLVKTVVSIKKVMVAAGLDLTQYRDTRTTEEPRTPIVVKSFLTTMSLRIFLERRKSASRPPRIMQIQPEICGSDDSIPLVVTLV